MTPSTPQQLRTRARFEALIGLGAPVLDLVLAAGDRISRVGRPRGRLHPDSPPRSERLSAAPRPPRAGRLD